MPIESANLEAARRYLAAIENGAPFEILAEFFAPDVIEERRTRLSVFLDFRDGKIVGQRNYDCFEPW